ncbi:hypothetical protein [Algivirga pacifica]|uniref:Internalin A n=1 Tax=Algivirga pacifica TaxID=1162670 RepID=A0ABP9DCW1_9BACT
MKLGQIFLTVLLIFLAGTSTFAQDNPKENVQSAERIKEYKEEITYMITYLQETFNFLGSAEEIAADKSIIINETYLKLFRDEEVQIEDDLDPNRQVPTNKDVQAYLKDIEFFFDSATFEFRVEEINHGVTDEGTLFFTVNMQRILHATTIEGETIEDTRDRFAQINLDPYAEELKIVSLYTTKLKQEEEKANWWNGLPQVWKDFLGQEKYLQDSVSMQDVLAVQDTLLLLKDSSQLPLSEQFFAYIDEIRSQEELDLSTHKELENLEPVSKMRKLKKLNIDGLAVKDLVPLRSLTHLQYLNCSNTQVRDLSPLQYCNSMVSLNISNTLLYDLSALVHLSELEELNISYTPTTDLSPIAALINLQKLNISEVNADDLSPLSSLTVLKELDLSGTAVNTLNEVGKVPSLERLDISRTGVKDLFPIQALKNLKQLFADHTSIEDLMPLQNLTDLERIYCDGTYVGNRMALQFMRQQPKTLVIYDSQQLRRWWNDLSAPWVKVFADTYQENTGVALQDSLTKEALQRIANFSSIDLSNNKEIQSLAPLSNLVNLKELHIDSTSISSLRGIEGLYSLETITANYSQIKDLSSIRTLTDLKILEVSNTLVDDLQSLRVMSELEQLNVSNTKVYDIMPLVTLQKLKLLNLEGTEVVEKQAEQFAISHEQCLVLYREKALTDWWSKLSPEWKAIFQKKYSLDTPPTSVQLHQIGMTPSLDLGYTNLKDIYPLGMLPNLRKLNLTELKLTDILVIAQLKELESLICRRLSVEDLSPIAQLPKLKTLDVSECGIDDLDFVSSLYTLEELRVSGNNDLSSLKDLKNLRDLKKLDCSSTNVKKLKYLYELTQLESIKCYNSRVSSSRAADLKAAIPACEVSF